MDKLNTTPPYAVDAQNEYQIQLSQRKIIEAIEYELSLEDEFYKPQSMFHSVWFFPERGMFMYADCLIRHEVIRPLIENKTLVFKGVEQHQGELMPRYVLPSANGSYLCNKVCFFHGV